MAFASRRGKKVTAIQITRVSLMSQNKYRRKEMRQEVRPVNKVSEMKVMIRDKFNVVLYM